MARYRLSWENVRQGQLGRYMNADPTFYKNCTQTIPNSQIPDEDWYPVSTETDDPWDQYDTLRKWAAADTQFVRDVRVEEMTAPPTWEPVPVDPVTGEVLDGE
jgi:hypothetical protein